jgi:hypothetical protein
MMNDIHPAVLILAHQGIQNPNIWISWSKSDPKHPIQLYVVNEDKSIIPQDGFTLLDIPLIPSTWGSKEIVINTMTAFKEIVNKKPKPTIIYLVSGYCLPIQQPNFLYQTIHRTKKTHANFYSTITWNPQISTFPILKDTTSEVVSSVQWISLTSNVIHQLVDDSKLIKDTPDFYGTPDEYYIQTLVRRLGVPTQNYSLMDASYIKKEHNSPIIWDLNNENKIEIMWGPRSSRLINAWESLTFAHKSGYVFSRKFKKILDYNDFNTFFQRICEKN